MKKILALLIICTFIFTYSSFASENTPLKNIGNGLNNIVYGSVETPDNVNQTNSKGTNFTNCTDKTKDGVGRTIVRVVGGLWQVLTFWYPSK